MKERLVEVPTADGRMDAFVTHPDEGGPFPAGHAFAREVTVAFVVGDPIRLRSQAIAVVRSGRLDPTAIVSHRLPLDDAARGYELFDQAEASKVVLTTGD